LIFITLCFLKNQASSFCKRILKSIKNINSFLENKLSKKALRTILSFLDNEEIQEYKSSIINSKTITDGNKIVIKNIINNISSK